MRLNHHLQGARVLYAGHPYGAILYGTPLYVNWYSPQRSIHFASIKTLDDVQSFIRDEQVEFAILNLTNQSLTGQPHALLREYMSQYAYPKYQEGAAVLYQVVDQAVSYQEIFSLTNPQTIPKGQPRMLSSIHVNGKSSVRYRMSFKCSENQGDFLAKVNWNAGDPYYRFIQCKSGVINFSESFPIPMSATKGNLFITAHDVPNIRVSSLTIEVH
jgi:hypothetical protein